MMTAVYDELTVQLDQLVSVHQQVREARARERTARFYRLIPRPNGGEPIADGLELSGGWVLLTWRQAHHPVRVYASIGDCYADLAAEGRYWLVLDDVSERTVHDADHVRVSHSDTPLTSRERSVLRQLRHGLTNSEIGMELCLNEQTIKNTLAKIYFKLGNDVQTRIQAVLMTADWMLDDIPDDNS